VNFEARDGRDESTTPSGLEARDEVAPAAPARPEAHGERGGGAETGAAEVAAPGAPIGADALATERTARVAFDGARATPAGAARGAEAGGGAAANDGRAAGRRRAGGPDRRVLAAAAGLFGLVAGTAVTVHAIDEGEGGGKVARGVMLGGEPIGGLDAAALEARAGRYAEALAGRRLVVRAGSHAAETTVADAGFVLDVPATVAAGLRFGREGAWPARWAGWLGRLVRPVELRPVGRLDEERAGAAFDALEGAMPERPFAGAVRAAGGRAEAEYPRPGSRIDRDRARALVLERVAMGDEALAMPLVERPAPLPREAVDGALARARRALGGPACLVAADGACRARFAPEELGAALVSRPAPDGAPRLDVSLSVDAVEAKLAPLRAELDEAPADARFEVAGDRVAVVPARPGRRLDAAAAAEALWRAAEAGGGREAPLPFGPGPGPALSTADAEALRVTRLVAGFTTRHGCCEPRVQNIHRIADLIDGTLVRPGETFSVNARVGPRTPERGFVFAPSIAEHETVETVGGGVSQFATTFFNALIDGGYEIIERQPHSFYFSRYPKGHEATLSFPKPDLVFRNDTDAGVLIKVDYGNDFVRVRLFGDNGGRKVERKVSPDFDFREPPVEYEPNPGLSPTEEKVVAHGTRGWSVLVSRVITYPDGASKEEKRKVTYLARPRRVEVHPCRVPKGARGHTGKPCPRPEAPPPAPDGAIEASAAEHAEPP
jgi:vancomycin resistance protein YoaR